jgi:DNA-binding transcriptional MocR family regulator
VLRVHNLLPTERVEECIRQAIYRGELKPRERVIEEDLAKHLSCSRGPVREAMQRLERDVLNHDSRSARPFHPRCLHRIYGGSLCT